LGARILRFERDFAAIVPLTPRRNQNAMAGPQESRSGFSLAGAPNYGRPIRRLMSAGLAPSPRNSRKPVARVDLESFWPATSSNKR
jgi:hypothetical protein